MLLLYVTINYILNCSFIVQLDAQLFFNCKRYVIPYSAHFYCALYMFCIGLMMAVLRPKHVALM
jgi:hypothetical protein